MKSFTRGLRAGLPIGLGYLSVSFTFGIMAIASGLSWWQAVVISMATVTSAGQLSAIGTMALPGQYAAMLVSQLTINLRYAFMSMSLSQKTSPKFKGVWRWILGFFMTDEIFAAASAEKTVSVRFFAGLSVAPWIGWTLGTLAGALIGNVLPSIVMGSLCLAIYGMFLAIVLPPARASRSVLVVVLIAAAIHCALYYIPYLCDIPSGISISICAIVSALIGAFLFPVNDEEKEVADDE
jgi:predicted branched-subunit amino acid permease